MTFTPLEIALRLYRDGHLPIPLKPSTKRPYFKDWPHHRFTSPKEIRQHWHQHPHDLVGVLTGHAYFVLDRDGGDLTQLEATYGELTPTLTVLTGGGKGHEHRYYRCPPNLVVRNSTSKLAPGWDVRGAGGQVVAPGNVHPTTKQPYLIDGSDDIGLDLDEMAPAPDWLAAWLGAQATPPAASDWSDYAPFLAEDQHHADHVAAIAVALEDGAISGEAGHNQTFRVACLLARHGLDQAHATEALNAYNARCSPPWTAPELRHKLDDAYRAVHDQDAIGIVLDPMPLAYVLPDEWAHLLEGAETDPSPPSDAPSPPVSEENDHETDPNPSSDPEFPLHVLPIAVQNYALMKARMLGVYPGEVAAALLPALGAAVGACRLSDDNSHRHPPTLWVALIGDVGAAKTPIFKAATRFLEDIETTYRQRHEQDLTQWEEECQPLKRTDPKPPRPSCERLVVKNFTPEAVLPLLNDNPRGLICALDELSTLIAGRNQYKGGKGNDTSILIELHGYNRIAVDRKGDSTSGPIALWSRHRVTMSILGGIQPNVFQRLLTKEDADSGFLQRFLPVRLRPPTDEMIEASADAEANPHTIAALEDLFASLRALRFENDPDDGFGENAADQDSGPLTPIHVPLHPDAATLWRPELIRLRKLARDAETPLAKALHAKFIMHTMRIALVLHLTDRAVHPQTDHRITSDQIRRAMALAQWWHHETTAAFRSVETETAPDTIRRSLQPFLDTQAPYVTPRDIMRTNRTIKGAELARGVLIEAAKLGFGTWQERIDTGKPGRPPAGLVLTPNGQRR